MRKEAFPVIVKVSSAKSDVLVPASLRYLWIFVRSKSWFSQLPKSRDFITSKPFVHPPFTCAVFVWTPCARYIICDLKLYRYQKGFHKIYLVLQIYTKLLVGHFPIHTSWQIVTRPCQKWLGELWKLSIKWVSSHLPVGSNGYVWEWGPWSSRILQDVSMVHSWTPQNLGQPVTGFFCAPSLWNLHSLGATFGRWEDGIGLAEDGKVGWRT